VTSPAAFTSIPAHRLDHPQVKTPPVKLANDNCKAEDHLVAVTLGIHATLGGLAAPVDMLIEVLSFEAPADAITPPPRR
jgi:hypothetical protein